MEEVDERVCGEEPALLIGSPMCRAFSTLIELTRATGKFSEVKHRSLVERRVRHLRFCFRMCNTQRNAGRLILHEHPRDARSRGLSFFNETAENDGVCKTKGGLCRQRTVSKRVGVEHALVQPRWTGQKLDEEVCVGCVERLDEGD